MGIKFVLTVQRRRAGTQLPPEKSNEHIVLESESHIAKTAKKKQRKPSTPDHTGQNKNHHGFTTDTGISSLAFVVQKASKDATGAQDKHPSVIFKNAARVQVAKVTAINTEGIWPRIQG